jgi:hypothetical protein
MQNSQPKPSRRGFFLTAAVTGAAAAAVSTLPSMPAQEPAITKSKPAPEKGGGYSLTDHVKQYYKTTLV